MKIFVIHICGPRLGAVVIIKTHKPTQAQSFVVCNTISKIITVVGVFVQRMCGVEQSLAIAIESRVVATVGFHIRACQKHTHLHGRVLAIIPGQPYTVDIHTIIAKTSAALHIAASIVVPTIADVPVVPQTQISVMIIVSRSVVELIVEKHGIVQHFVVGCIEGIHHCLNLQSELQSFRFGMWFECIVENKEQTLVAFDVGIVAVGRVVTSIAIHVDKGGHVFGITSLTVRGPGQDVVRRLITRLSVTGNEILDFGTGQIPHAVILQSSHQIDSSILRFQRPRPILLTQVSVGKRCKVNGIMSVRTTNPKRMLEHGFLPAALWHLPSGTISMVVLYFIVPCTFLWNKARPVSEDGSPHIVGLNMRDGGLLRHGRYAHRAQ